MNEKSKAYKINFSKIEEGYLASEQVCYADNRNEARSILLKEVRYDNWKLKYSDEELTYLNIPVIRAKYCDKIYFEGKLITRSEHEQLIQKRERFAELDKILNDPTIEYCYIIKRVAFYRPNSSWYTDKQSRAGVYSKSEAVCEAKSCDQITIRPIDIEHHNKLLESGISYLNSRLL